MTNAEIVAVAKVLKDAQVKNASSTLVPGEYPIDCLVRVFGSIKKGENESYIPTVDIPIIDAMILFCHDAGITGTNACNALQRAMTRAIEQDEEAKEIIQNVRADMTRAENTVRSMLDALPPKERIGKVTTKLTIEPVNVELELVVAA